MPKALLEIAVSQRCRKYSASTAQDRHSRLVDFDALRARLQPEVDDLQKLYNPENYDFALMPGSTAIDAGTLLPTITDGFTGKAPDLGALEFGRPAPHYGPRTRVPGIVPQDKAGSGSSVGPPRVSRATDGSTVDRISAWRKHISAPAARPETSLARALDDALPLLAVGAFVVGHTGLRQSSPWASRSS